MSGETEVHPSGWTVDVLNSHLTELLDERDKRHDLALRSVVQQFTTQLDGYDRAITVLQTTTNRSPTPGEIDLDLKSFKGLVGEMLKVMDARFGTVGEQFSSIANEFRLRNENDKQQAIDRKEELKTALSAAEKAVDKSGTATGELLRQQVELLRTTKEGLDTQIGDVKVRLATAEANASSAEKSAASALASQRSDTTTHQVDRGFNSQVMFNAFTALVAVGAIAVAILKP